MTIQFIVLFLTIQHINSLIDSLKYLYLNPYKEFQMEDIIKETTQTIKDRIKNPFVISFMIAFFVFNWKGFAYFFYSDEIITNRIINSTAYSNFGTILFYPIIIALIYVIVLPFFTMWLDKKLMQLLEKRKIEIQHSIEQHRIKIIKYENIDTTIDNYEKDIKEKENEIINLNEKYNDFFAEFSHYKQVNDDILMDLSNIELETTEQVAITTNKESYIYLKLKAYEFFTNQKKTRIFTKEESKNFRKGTVMTPKKVTI